MTTTPPDAPLMPQPTDRRVRREFTTEQYAGRLGDGLLGLGVPGLPRPPLWNTRQQTSFIESLYLNFEPSPLVIVSFRQKPDFLLAAGTALRLPTDRHQIPWLLDGYQRCAAIERYLSSAFPVFGTHWKDLTRTDQRRFMGTALHGVHLNGDDHTPATLHDTYVRLNPGRFPSPVHAAQALLPVSSSARALLLQAVHLTVLNDPSPDPGYAELTRALNDLAPEQEYRP